MTEGNMNPAILLLDLHKRNLKLKMVIMHSLPILINHNIANTNIFRILIKIILNIKLTKL